MRNTTRSLFLAFASQIALINAVPDVGHTFTVAPSVEQKLEQRIQESSDFLTRINMATVTEMEGERLGLGVSGLIASRTDTSGDKERKTRDPHGLTAFKYRCEKTNFDTHLRYAQLDAWAKFPNFQTLIRDAIVKAQGRDRMRIGFNGKTVALESDPVANPNGEDLNKGWLQHIREQAPERVLNAGPKGNVGKVNIGAGLDYESLDALVFDLVTALDPWHQEDTGLVVILGRDLLHDKYFPLVNSAQAPTEQLARDVIVSQKRVGGLPAVRVPFFPAGTLLITTYDNLSIYTQEGTRRRRVVDNAARDRVENFESVNDAYVVEDFGRAAMAENIVFGAGAEDDPAAGLVEPADGE